jgi:hypothetical protein
MKTSKFASLILVAAMGMISFNTMAQKKVKTVPLTISSAFARQYPLANLKSWNTENGQYVAMFKYNKRDWKAYYSADGNWLSSERDIRHMATLPFTVRSAFKGSKYAAYHIDRMASLQTPTSKMYLLRIDNNNGNPTAYQAAGSVDNETLYYNERGRLVKLEGHNNE